MLDERHDSLPQDRGDHNNYTLGRIGQHNGVTAYLSACRINGRDLRSNGSDADTVDGHLSEVRFNGRHRRWYTE